MAEEGIFYFFGHSESAHTLILTDAPLSTPVLEHAGTIPYNARSGGQLTGSAISSFSQHEKLRSSGHGTDVVAIDNGPPPRVKVIEVKSGSSGLNKGQEQGGEYHFGTVIDRARENKAFSGQGVWQKLDDFADDGLTVNNYDYEIWKYDKFDPNDPSSIGNPTKTDWTAGTVKGEFQLDANGDIMTHPSGRRKTTSRDYTTVE